MSAMDEIKKNLDRDTAKRELERQRREQGKK